jgi:hypothetical protein
MREIRRAVLMAVVAGLACFAGGGLSSAAEPETAPQKSIRGTLRAVNERQSGVGVETADGKRQAWRFNPRVVAEAAKVELGSPVIVIYRQIGADKRVTALAFPDPNSKPVYVNLTGDRVLLRTAAAAADGTCNATAKEDITETIIPVDGRAEAIDGCWCCAPTDGGVCLPATKTGAGRALLDRCFQ